MDNFTDYGKIINMELTTRGRCLDCFVIANTHRPHVKVTREFRVRHEFTWEVTAVGREVRQRCYLVCAGSG